MHNPIQSLTVPRDSEGAEGVGWWDSQPPLDSGPGDSRTHRATSSDLVAPYKEPRVWGTIVKVFTSGIFSFCSSAIVSACMDTCAHVLTCICTHTCTHTQPVPTTVPATGRSAKSRATAAEKEQTAAFLPARKGLFVLTALPSLKGCANPQCRWKRKCACMLNKCWCKNHMGLLSPESYPIQGDGRQFTPSAVRAAPAE